ncbi:MAG: ROK family protein [Bacteroidota bacterium]
MSKLAIGVDIGGTNSKFGFADEDGNIIAQSRIKTQSYSDYRSYIAELKKEIDALHPIEEAVGIGIGAPNANFYTGTIEHPPNLPWKGVSHFSQEKSL